MTDDDLIQQLRNSKGWPTLGNAAADRIEELIAERDRAAQEARAVALESVIANIRLDVENDDISTGAGQWIIDTILALLDTPAAEALERVRAEAYLSGWVNGSNGIEPPDFGNPVFDDDAIRAEGET